MTEGERVEMTGGEGSEMTEGRLVEMTRKGGRDDRGGKRDDHPLSFRAESRNLK